MSLKPWREVIVPHRDVFEGTFQASEFAADLSKVSAGVAIAEYQDPKLFFERTFITEGMALLLESVVRRLSGKDGDPVIQLQTAFGGGKTHSMLAAYHAARGEKPASELSGIPTILDRVGVMELPKGKVAILDGNALSPSQPRKHGGVKANTLWGEMAWQLGDAEGYEFVAKADAEGTSPGKEDLSALFAKVGPSVILMDEMVAYIRQFEDGKTYSGGTFASNASFIQALTEAVSMTPKVVLLASLPESDMELGGQRGKDALETLQKYFGRKEAIWKPVGTQEGFEIVRRRLFGPVKDEVARDATAKAFADLYINGGAHYPNETQEGVYYDQLKAAYPIHPEVFQRLYEDWATLEKFQRTRGVLRLMAIVIHKLWSDDNKDLMILPASMPLYDQRVRNELLRYLPQGWEPVAERDVDGTMSSTKKIDETTPILGEVQAARRVARTVFLGSAPSVAAQKVRGIDVTRIRLGCTQPGQQAGRYEDALKRLADQLFYLYSGNGRYWYDTRPNLRREMEDRMGRFDRDKDLVPEIGRRLKSLIKSGVFGGVHVFTLHGDVPDDHEIRLVVLPPTNPHKRKDQTSWAVTGAKEVMEKRGSSPRLNQNRLLFLASDEEQVGRLYDDAKRHLAWKSINDDVGTLNLDQFQTKEAKKNLEDSDGKLTALVREVYRWVLSPVQDATPGKGLGGVRWEEFSLPSGGSDISVAIKKGAEDGEILIPAWSPYHLKNILEGWYWPNSPEANVKRLWEDFCRYPYLPRLTSAEVLKSAIAEGVAKEEFFGYAQGKADGEYKGFVLGEPATIYIDAASRVIELETARAAKAEKAASASTVEPSTVFVSPADLVGGVTPPTTGTKPITSTQTPTKAAKRFYAKAELDPIKMGLQSADIAKEVIGLFTSQLGNAVKITLEVEVTSPSGFSDSTQRAAKENCNTLKFEFSEFSEE